LLDISDLEFTTLRDLVRERFGIWYDDQKRFLLLSRLSTRVAKRGFETFGAYVRFLKDDPRREDEWTDLASVLSNNETYFFRERAQLKALAAGILDEFIKRSPRVRLWSAACSSGEEAFSLAMTLIETGKIPDTMLSIRATDISPRVLELAERGYYRALSFRATEPPMLHRWFRAQGDGFAIDDRVKKLVSFGRLNLLDSARVAAEGPFDAIFCRNVLIYFDKPTQKRVVESFAKALRPGGYLFLGHAESLFHLTDLYEPIIGPDAIVYRLKGDGTKLRVTA
jgi:chemotaxis protein methyltransferase CheR